MRNDGQKGQGGVIPGNPGKGSTGGFFSLRSLSGYLRIVSSGASTVASTVKSAGVSVVSSLTEDDALRDQVQWSGFDKLEFDDNVSRQVLLLGYRSGFEVWDVEEADDVRKLASRRDGPVSFLQVQKMPIASKRSQDIFTDVRPLLVIAGDGSASNGFSNHDGVVSSVNTNNGCQELGNGNFIPTSIQFYSLKTNSFVHVLKFRSAIFSIRCSPRVVAILQAAQIHCFDAATLEREYTILTYPAVWSSIGPGSMGYGPLAVGSRWLAYSGSPVAVSSTGRVSPQNLTSTTNSSSTSNGSFVVHYARESSKQLASGLVTIGDMGYKKLSRYYSEVLHDGNNSLKQRNHCTKTLGGHSPDAENAGMVIVRDLVFKSVVVQFRAHRSPISALCFDPSGILLVTASIHGHNINIFSIMPSSSGRSSVSDASGTFTHLYRLQRGFTNAVIQDISFSDDSEYIMISSSRGTSHLFALSLSGESRSHPYNVNIANGSNGLAVTNKASVLLPPSSGPSKPQHDNIFSTGPPITLSVVSRIRNGGTGWKVAVSGAAAAATGKVNPLCGAIASTFHNCKGTHFYPDINSLRTKYYLLVFSPSGCIIQYALRHSTPAESAISMPVPSFGSNEFSLENDTGILVEALQKWDVCHKRNRRDHGDDIDIYGENGNSDSKTYPTKATTNSKTYPTKATTKRDTYLHPTNGTETKKLPPEEKLHLHISEVELHMHPVQVPLWGRRNICFQVMTNDFPKVSAGTVGGEIEIERIPTRTIEARSKDLIPAFDYLQMPRYQQMRLYSVQSNGSGFSASQKSDISDNVEPRGGGSCGSSINMSECALADTPDLLLNGWDNHRPSLEAIVDIVNKTDNASVNTQHECVNNRECSKMEDHIVDGDSDTD